MWGGGAAEGGGGGARAATISLRTEQSPLISFSFYYCSMC
jgi:hypothetical protein